MDALTGKSNFDIAEWMLIHLLGCLAGRRGTIGMLVKTHVARRTLAHAWAEQIPIAFSRMLLIDAKKHFDVSADACLLICQLGDRAGPADCLVGHLERSAVPENRIGFRDGQLVSDLDTYGRLHEMLADPKSEQPFRWRSGIKHDCAKVMELTLKKGRLVNGLDETVDIEDSFLFPMLKGSDVANGRTSEIQRYMLVTQQRVGDDTSRIAHVAPRTWAYLTQHSALLAGRASSIYRGRPHFSIFGVGDYTFAPWKVAICGLYKKTCFTVIGPQQRRPVVCDDTVYHLSFQHEGTARAVEQIVNSIQFQELLGALVFLDAKRPITADVLRRIDLPRVARQLGHSLSCTESPLHSQAAFF